MLVHNPSNQEVFYQRVKVPTDTYKVSSWNTETKSFEVVRSTTYCHKFTYQSNITTYDCNLVIENTVKANSYSMLLVELDP